MSLEKEQSEFRRRSREAEYSAEAKETGHGEDRELQKAAAMERAEVIVKEAKQSRKQMQNIVLHMQTVLSAIRQLRQQLQLAQVDDDVDSIKQDKKRIEELKKKIQDYGMELEKMRGDLVREQMEELKNGIGVGLSSEELQRRAEELVDEMIKEVNN